MTKLSPATRAEVNKYAIDFVKKVEKQCQDEIYVDFHLAHIKLDWSHKRSASRGGMYADGPGINIAMNWLYKDSGEIYYCNEYSSFDSDPEIGGFYSRNRWHRLEMVLLHEIAHALQYYSYKINKFRCKPHGPTFKNFYRRLRNIHLNPFLPEQGEIKFEYEKKKKDILKNDEFFQLYQRAASPRQRSESGS